MESIVTKYDFLKKPVFTPKSLTYVSGSKNVYVNLFKLSSNKNFVMYVYSCQFFPEIDTENMRTKRQLFNHMEKEIRAIYKDLIFSGDNLYSPEQVADPKEFIAVHSQSQIKYSLVIRKTDEKVLMSDANIDKPIVKTVYELMVKEILRANPNLEFYRDLCVRKDGLKTISSKSNKIDFYPGYFTSVLNTAKGAYLVVSIKNKLLSNQNCLEIINQKFKDKAKTRDGQEELREFFVGRQIKTTYSKRTQKIDDITFDKNPSNATFNKDGASILLTNYYKVAHNITIKDTKQPLFVVRKYDEKTKTPIALYFVPELVHLAGIDDSVVKDGFFMKELAKETKLNPAERVTKTNQFMALLDEKTLKEQKIREKDKGGKEVREKILFKYDKSSADLKKAYQLDIKPAETNDFSALTMKVPSATANNSNFYFNHRNI
jgi:hypothetical protein